MSLAGSDFAARFKLNSIGVKEFGLIYIRIQNLKTFANASIAKVLERWQAMCKKQGDYIL